MVVLIGEWGFLVREHNNRVGFEVVVDLTHLDLVAFLGHTSVDAASRVDVHEHQCVIFPGQRVDELPISDFQLISTTLQPRWTRNFSAALTVFSLSLYMMNLLCFDSLPLWPSAL